MFRRSRLRHLEITRQSFHFLHRGRNYQGGYVAEYREEQELTPGAEEVPWMRKEVPLGEFQPKLTVEGLQPNTLYEVRAVKGNTTLHIAC